MSQDWNNVVKSLGAKRRVLNVEMYTKIIMMKYCPLMDTE